MKLCYFLALAGPSHPVFDFWFEASLVCFIDSQKWTCFSLSYRLWTLHFLSKVTLPYRGAFSMLTLPTMQRHFSLFWARRTTPSTSLHPASVFILSKNLIMWLLLALAPSIMPRKQSFFRLSSLNKCRRYLNYLCQIVVISWWYRPFAKLARLLSFPPTVLPEFFKKTHFCGF